MALVRALWGVFELGEKRRRRARGELVVGERLLPPAMKPEQDTFTSVFMAVQYAN